ncbi:MULTISPECIES: FadR/GntR family transcriptional regulator [Rhizobium/Agrobacterium group]|uniref:FadR/GntR family transcriptional regulator n=1 Tax=Rhizobium/Agrobacterium group TaxID=227290 RepID=UPI000B4065A3|nr:MULTISPECIES: FadR/GntR family transcriptional regulator [Rhizobium/Agrobacterium group]MCF1480804.1 FadR family transcriptional regulator [Allorhizobium ampelinum]NSZ44656.1 FadR family transcriptional regulator [Agrobacterium vitis]NTA28403.1 FadR family transcriptional regulator [Allorhizobium ampelinum]OVE93031.1 GntR family transcriptional regulator [Allorhizobium ampelinum]
MTLPKRLYQQIADQVRHLIQTGPYPAGARLPPERELAQTLGVSRPSLREALIALEIDGTIEIRMGSGIYVLSASKSVVSGRSLGESPTELMQARAVIESAVIVKAAAAMTDAVFAALVGIVESMRQEIAEGRKPIDQDRQFHLTIAEQSGNSVLAEIVANLFDERHSPISDHIRGRFETPETWSLALIEHEAILTALEARDPLAAQAAIYAHLTASRRRWLEN